MLSLSRVEKRRISFFVFLVALCAFLDLRLASAQEAPDKKSADAVSDNSPTDTNQVSSASRDRGTRDVIARIREEGLNHSQAMETITYLTEVIGPRLTGSPNLKRANEWTRDKLACWGLTNAHLEAWGPFGRGWSLKRFSAQIIEPQTFPIIGCPSAWSPGLQKALEAEVVFFDVQTNADREKYRGKLAGKIVLSGAMRELKPAFEPFAERLMETNLLRLANAGDRSIAGLSGVFNTSRFGDPERRGSLGSRDGERPQFPGASGAPSDARRGPPRGRFRGSSRNLSFLAQEGAALVINPSYTGDGGTYFVAGASVPLPEGQDTNSMPNAPRVWSTNVPAIPPQMTVAAEDYNRMARMIQQGEKLKMAVDLQVQFHDDDLMAYNTIAEIPGSDLKHELVMLGAHLDSWHSGTGATDNGAGVAATMEAVRILTALKLQPRRTIRIGLWSGEEQGLIGSKAYVTNHFGYFHTNTANSTSRRAPKDTDGERVVSRTTSTNSSPARKLARLAEYEKLSAYFNLDNGAGKIRGIYLQGNEAVRPLFRRWLAPFADLGAETISLADTGGTDHLSFDTIGLPGFEFIQDPLDYRTRTHHSNEDVLDRVQPDDLKQAATIIAAFVYNAAMLEEKLPRKPVTEPREVQAR